MFLNRLTEKEKKTFICLAISAANANNEISYEESNYIKEYCNEMEINAADVIALGSQSITDIANVFEKSEESHKRIVLFELIAFMYVDGSFDEFEKQYIYDFTNKIGFSLEITNAIINIVEKYVTCVTEISEFIF